MHDGFDTDGWANVLLIGTMEATANEKQYGPRMTLPFFTTPRSEAFVIIAVLPLDDNASTDDLVSAQFSDTSL